MANSFDRLSDRVDDLRQAIEEDFKQHRQGLDGRAVGGASGAPSALGGNFTDMAFAGTIGVSIARNMAGQGGVGSTTTQGPDFRALNAIIGHNLTPEQQEEITEEFRDVLDNVGLQAFGQEPESSGLDYAGRIGGMLEKYGTALTDAMGNIDAELYERIERASQTPAPFEWTLGDEMQEARDVVMEWYRRLHDAQMAPILEERERLDRDWVLAERFWYKNTQRASNIGRSIGLHDALGISTPVNQEGIGKSAPFKTAGGVLDSFGRQVPGTFNPFRKVGDALMGADIAGGGVGGSGIGAGGAGGAAGAGGAGGAGGMGAAAGGAAAGTGLSGAGMASMIKPIMALAGAGAVVNELRQGMLMPPMGQRGLDESRGQVQASIPRGSTLREGGKIAYQFKSAFSGIGEISTAFAQANRVW